MRSRVAATRWLTRRSMIVRAAYGATRSKTRVRRRSAKHSRPTQRCFSSGWPPTRLETVARRRSAMRSRRTLRWVYSTCTATRSGMQAQRRSVMRSRRTLSWASSCAWNAVQCGSRALANAQKHDCPHSIWSNEIGDAGAAAIGEGLQTNTRLIELGCVECVRGWRRRGG